MLRFYFHHNNSPSFILMTQSFPKRDNSAQKGLPMSKYWLECWPVLWHYYFCWARGGSGGAGQSSLAWRDSWWQMSLNMQNTARKEGKGGGIKQQWWWADNLLDKRNHRVCVCVCVSTQTTCTIHLNIYVLVLAGLLFSDICHFFPFIRYCMYSV